jgi:hypothetical protein
MPHSRTPPPREPGDDDPARKIEHDSGLSGAVQQQGGAALANIGKKRPIDQLGEGSDEALQGERRDRHGIDESTDGED